MGRWRRRRGEAKSPRQTPGPGETDTHTRQDLHILATRAVNISTRRKFNISIYNAPSQSQGPTLRCGQSIRGRWMDWGDGVVGIRNGT